MKKIKRVEQKPLYVTWRGDLRELCPIVSEHASGFSIVERLGSHLKRFRMVPNDDTARDLIWEWLKEHGSIVPPGVKVQRNFKKEPGLKINRMRVDESPEIPKETIEQLDKEWKSFQETGKCPKCQELILGPSVVYDDTFDKMSVISCMCGKHLFGGSAHLERAKQMMKTPTKGHIHRRRAPVSV